MQHWFLQVHSVRVTEAGWMENISSFDASLCLVLLLHCTAVAPDVKYSSPVTVRDGANVTLSCNDLKDLQSSCDRTSWSFSGARSGEIAAVKLSERGKIYNDAGPQSGRLRVTENCSLVVQRVSAGDAGLYICKQITGQEHDSTHAHPLSVVSITEEEDGENVTLTCSVEKSNGCPHSVRWLYQGRAVGEALSDVLASQSACRATLHLLTSHHVHGSSSRFLSCAVISDVNSEEVTFSLQTSPEESGEDETVATGSSMTAGWLWLGLVVGVASAAVLVLVVIRRMRNTGDKRRPQDDTGHVSSPQPDPEDGVFYTSVSFTRRSGTDAQVHRRSDDDAAAAAAAADDNVDTVTYSTLKGR